MATQVNKMKPKFLFDFQVSLLHSTFSKLFSIIPPEPLTCQPICNFCCNKFCLFSCFCLLFLYVPFTLNTFYFHLAHQNHVHPSKFGLNGFLSGSDGKESACNAGDQGSIPESGRCPRKRNGNPLQYSCLESSIDRGTWQASVHGVAKSRTQLSD